MSELSHTPTLSVVVASLTGRPYIDACLESLAHQRGNVMAEVVVADCVGAPVTNFVKRHYPDTQLIEFSERKTVAELRAAGLSAARGDIVAITEDHCIAAEDWFEWLLRAHTAHSGPAIGGAVDNARRDRLIDWAVYLCEYGNFASPVTHGAVRDLAGANVSYKRVVLDEMREAIKDGYREGVFHRQMEAAGYALWSDPSLCVLHNKHFALTSFIAERFHYGRWYAGMRGASSTLPKRLCYVALSPLLPPLLLYRLHARVRRRPQHRRTFLKCLPLIGLFTLVWAAGEFVGGLSGPGRSELHLS